MKKFIGAMIFGVIVVIYMVVELNRQPPTEQRPSPNARVVDDNQWGDAEQAEMRPANDEVHPRAHADDYVSPQPSSLAEVEAKRDRNPAGRNTINLDLVPYQLEFEPVDHQWFREMEQALYSISYDVLEPIGARMVNLECATSVCVADFDIPSHAHFDRAEFGRAAESMDIFDREALSMVFLSSEGVLERIIFQRKE